LPSRMDVLDVCVLSAAGTVWLIPPAYLEWANRPFVLAAWASLIGMALALATGSLWCFVARRAVESRLRVEHDEVRGRLAFFAFLGYFWSLADDRPIYFDSVLTWPEVTGGAQHLFLEVLLHALTLAFFLLALRAAIGGANLLGGARYRVALLTIFAFWSAYFQNTPLAWVQALGTSAWFSLDALEHLVSVGLFCLAVTECLRRKDIDRR